MLAEFDFFSRPYIGTAPQPLRNSGSNQNGLVIAPQQPSKKQVQKRPDPLGLAPNSVSA